VFHVSDVGGIIAFFAGSIYFFHRALKDQDWFHVAPLAVFYSALVVHAVVLSALLVGDTTSYFAQLEEYSSIAEYVQVLIANILSDPIWLGNFLQKLPVVYLPSYFSLDLASPMFIVLINGVLWTLAVVMLTRLSVEHVATRIETFSPRLFFTFLLVRPTFLLYASQFNKEISVVFASVLAVYLFFEERYLSFLLAVVVAFVGILSALIALQLERLGEFAILRATGMTPRQVAALVLGQSGLMGLLAGLLAVPLGLVMADILIDVINRRSFGWSMQSILPAGVIAEALVLALAAALIAGIYPALKAARISPPAPFREE
jgi:hypothetical protein